VTTSVLGLDPGSLKCGYAVLAAPREVLTQGIVPPAGLVERLQGVLEAYPVRIIALGGGTRSAGVAAELAVLGLPIAVVDERETTLRARARFFDAHPPRGWRRFVPRGMLLPDRPIDDFAAVLIAERFFAAEAGAEAPPLMGR